MMTESEYQALLQESQSHLSPKELGRKMAETILDLPGDTRVIDLVTLSKPRYITEQEPPDEWKDFQSKHPKLVAKMNNSLMALVKIWKEDLELFGYNNRDPLNVGSVESFTVDHLLEYAPKVIEFDREGTIDRKYGYKFGVMVCRALVRSSKDD